MGSIKLKNIKVYAYHGCLTEEGKIGSDYLVNLKVEADLKRAAETDSLGDTIDYVGLQKIVTAEMAQRSQLLETVGKRIMGRIFKELKGVKKVKVSIAKVNPPIGGDVAQVAVTMRSSR
ncbi:MAG: dihydroneopterin aldolase [Marinirhabdus sp.]